MVKLCKIYEIKPRFCFKEGGTEKSVVNGIM